MVSEQLTGVRVSAVDPASGITVARDHAVWTVTIDRQNRRNALDDAAIEAIEQTYLEAEADPRVTGIVLTGAGGLAFCSGSDLKAVAEMTGPQQIAHTRRGQQLMNRIESSRLISIAAVEGFAFGGGFELALACDLIVAADSAQFALPELRKGMVPAWGGTFRLARVVGLARARAVILAGQVIDGKEAHRIGLAVETTKSGNAVGAARRLAAEGTGNASANTVELVKQMLVTGMRMDTFSASIVERLAETVLTYSEGYGSGGK